MIVLRNKEFTLKKVYTKARSKEGREALGRLKRVKKWKVKEFIKNLPKTHDPLTPEGAGRIVQDVIGNTGKVVGTVTPIPLGTVAGYQLDKHVLGKAGKAVGEGLTTAMTEAAPLYRYI